MALPQKQLLYYGFIGMPLAMAGLPLFMHIPPLFTQLYGIPMATIALVMVAIRALDALADPMIGHISDKFGTSLSRIRLLITIGAITLSLGLWGFAAPLPRDHAAVAFALVMGFSAIAYSLTMINALALGACLSEDYLEQNRINAWREGFSLIGVLLASALPMWLVAEGDKQGTMVWFGLLSSLATVWALGLLYRLKQQKSFVKHAALASPSWKAMFRPLRHRDMRWMLLVALFNAIATATPASLVMFYIGDVLETSQSDSAMLVGSYFLSGTLAMPGWLWLSRRLGKKRSWMVSMLVSGGAFAFASLLGSGDVMAFLLVCIASGLALGADLVFGPSMMGDVIHQLDAKDQQPGLVFGLWNFVNKSAITLAAVISMPLLAMAGYQPGGESPPDAIFWLSFAYGTLPLLFKSLAFVTLAKSPLDRRFG